MEENRNITPVEYTDRDMQIVARLAYIDFADDMIKDKWDNPLTLGEILENVNSYKAISKQLLGDGEPPESGSIEEIRYKDNVAFLEMLKTDPIYSNWKPLM